MAVGRLRGELRQVTLQPTVLVHEVVIGLLRHTPKVDDKNHLHSLASRMMRQFLVDEARRRSAQQRGGDQFQVTFDAERLVEPDAASELVELEAAPSRLETIDEGKARVIEPTISAAWTTGNWPANWECQQRDLRIQCCCFLLQGRGIAADHPGHTSTGLRRQAGPFVGRTSERISCAKEFQRRLQASEVP